MEQNNRAKFKTNRIIIFIVLFAPIIFYGWQIHKRSPLMDLQKQLFPGIVYQRETFDLPRPYVVNIVTIDLNKPQIIPVVNYPPPEVTDDRLLAMTTSSFVRKYNLQLAINGSFFYPFAENTPWSFYPHSGDAVYSLGESIAKQTRYGIIKDKWNVLCFSAVNIATIETKSCSKKAVRAIAGKEMLLDKGNVIVTDDGNNYARSGVGVDRTGKKLWLVVVDGKQPFYSEGVTLKEFAQIFANLGCDRALNLDGGGSSTLVMQNSAGITLLNAPIHTKIPMRERPIANHLGFKVLGSK